MLRKAMPLILHPNFTKIAALILGYSIWFFAATHQWVCQEYSVPVCFYQTEQRMIQAPESITLKISGSRTEMFHLKNINLAIHVDVDDYPDGDHTILLNSSNLFLPETLKLVELIPSCISCNIQSTIKKQ